MIRFEAFFKISAAVLAALLVVTPLTAAQAKKQGWELFPDADFASVVRDIKSWAPGKDAVEILFDPYSVAPYAAGSHEWTVSYRELTTLLKPDGPDRNPLDLPRPLNEQFCARTKSLFRETEPLMRRALAISTASRMWKVRSGGGT